MLDKATGLIRGIGGALGAAERGLVRISDAEEKRLVRLGVKEEAKTQREFLMSEAELGRAFTEKQNRLGRELTASEGEANRKSQELRIDLQAQGRLKSQGGSMLELQEKIAKLNATIRIADMNLAQKFTVTNQDDAQAFQKEQKELDRSLQESLQSDRIQARTSLQELQGSQTIAQIKEAQKNWIANAAISLKHSKQLETYVLNARDASSKLKEKRIAAQNVLNDARKFQYTAKEAELKFGYTLKGLEKQVELAIAAEGRASKEWERRVGITQTAEIKKLERIAELEDTYKEKWSKIESAAARDAQTKEDAVAFSKAVYDNAYASIKQLEKIVAELDPEADGYEARKKQLNKYIKKYHAEIVKPAQDRYSRYSGIEVLFRGSYEMNTSDESPEREAMEADAERTVAVVESIYELSGRTSEQSRNLPERLRTAIENGTIDDEDLSGDVAVLRASFLGDDDFPTEEAANAYLLDAYPTIFEGPNGEYTDANLKPMVVAALRTIAAEGDTFRDVQPRPQEKGGPLTALHEPGVPLPATEMGSPSEPFTPVISPETDPAAVLKESQFASISKFTKEEAETRLKKIRNLEANKGYAIKKEHLRALRSEKAMLMERLNELRKAPAQETGMINGSEDRGLLAQAGDVVVDMGETALETVFPSAQAADKPLGYPSGTGQAFPEDMGGITMEERIPPPDTGQDLLSKDFTNNRPGDVQSEPVSVTPQTTLTSDQVINSRLYKINNPTGIKITSDEWEGSAPSMDVEFVTFQEPEYAYRAAARTISRYGDGTSENTSGQIINDVGGIIHIWLGGQITSDGERVINSEEESLESIDQYLRNVSQITDGKLTNGSLIESEEDLAQLLYAISVVEMGGNNPYGDMTMEFIADGINMSGNWERKGRVIENNSPLGFLQSGPEPQFMKGAPSMNLQMGPQGGRMDNYKGLIGQ